MKFDHELGRKVLDQINNQPKTFRMADWEYEPPEGEYHSYYNPAIDDYEEAIDCGTTRCIAGWAIYFAAEERGLPVNRPLRDVRDELADNLQVCDNAYELLGMAVLGLRSSALFYQDDESAYRELVRLVEKGEADARLR